MSVQRVGGTLAKRYMAKSFGPFTVQLKTSDGDMSEIEVEMSFASDAERVLATDPGATLDSKVDKVVVWGEVTTATEMQAQIDAARAWAKKVLHSWQAEIQSDLF